jgi:putative ubiquitin-RnfH superfamily antitoxin RatB of RatAB toxin-antitoxin module
MMQIVVVYAEPMQQTLLNVHVAKGSTVLKAIDASGIRTLYPALSFDHVGIFGKKVTLETVLTEGDRIEIYRALPMDPKTARMLRAQQE